MEFWQWLVDNNLIQGDPSYYSENRAAPEEYGHAITTAANAARTAPPDVRDAFWQQLFDIGAVQGNIDYWRNNTFGEGDMPALDKAAINFFGGGGDPGSIGGGAQQIPPDATLVRVTNPVGGGGTRYFLEGTYAGVVMRWEIGDQDAFNDAFPSGGNFANVRTESTDDGYEGLIMGSAEELYGKTETLQAWMERGLREFGQEDLPAWMRADPEVMSILLSGAREEWSEGRILNLLSKTEAFAQRFPGIDTIRDRMGGTGTLQAAVDSYLQEETAIRNALREFRGPDTDLSTEYIGELIGTGWTAGEVDTVLEGEFRFRNNPEAYENLNEILAYQGLETVTPEQFLEAITGRAADESIAAINDALRFTALEQQGLEISPTLAAALGDDGELDLIDEQTLGIAAAEAAKNILRNNLELQAGKLGITKDDIIKTAFGEGATAETNEKLAQFARERQARARGVSGYSTFIDASSNLRYQGLSGL